MTARAAASVRVSIVGAGPGDPDLLTVRGVDRLRAADVVFHDGLVPQAVIQIATHARSLAVSRRDGADRFAPAVVAALMAEAAGAGAQVVRLRAGDPFVFARGAEEALALARAGVAFEIVPGLSSALAGPALANVPLTHRGLASGFLVVSGHAPEAYEPVLGRLPAGALTVVILMGLGRRAEIGRYLRASGWCADTPVAVVTAAGWPEQATWQGSLEALSRGAPAVGRTVPGVIVIGEVVRLAEILGTPVQVSDTHVEADRWQ